MVYNPITGERSFIGDDTDMHDTQVTALYLHGNSCSDIARSEGCSATTIYNRLKSLNVKMRSRSKANQIFPDSIFIALYNIGLSASQVGRLLGVAPSTVIKRLQTLHFPLRSRNVAYKIKYSEKEFKQFFMRSDIINQLMGLVCE